MPKYFFDTKQMVGHTIYIDGEQAHHLLNVLRMVPGESILLSDRHGTDYDCVISQIDYKKTKLTLSVEKTGFCLNEPSVKVTLYQSLPKGDKMEWIIQKCVELGIHTIVPVITVRTVVHSKDYTHKVERYRRISEAAAEQSMRGIIPFVHMPVSYEEAVLSAHEDLQLFAYEQERRQTIKQVLKDRQPAAVGLWVGPEGGFDDAEVTTIHGINGECVTLGPRVLRTETAGMAALVQVLCVLEE